MKVTGFNKTLILAATIFLLLLNGSYAQKTAENSDQYIPDIEGVLKTKVEFDLENSLMRFAVRNARFGVKGNINNYMSYRAEIDLSDEGIIKMLDAYVKFAPAENLGFYLGQRKIPFSTDYMRSPADNFFANRSFLAKYINDGMRDIGFYAEYGFTGSYDVRLLAGVVNGTGNNNPQWLSRPNFVSRVTAGRDEGIRLTGNLYYGNTSYETGLLMLGAEVRYSRGSFFIESEYIRRNWTDTLSSRVYDDGLYVHSYYMFRIENKIIRYATPVARIDFMGRSLFDNLVDAGRITAGINIGFEPKLFTSEIRLNYENYLKSSLPVHTDKITLEFIAKF